MAWTADSFARPDDQARGRLDGKGIIGCVVISVCSVRVLLERLSILFFKRNARGIGSNWQVAAFFWPENTVKAFKPGANRAQIVSEIG